MNYSFRKPLLSILICAVFLLGMISGFFLAYYRFIQFGPERYRLGELGEANVMMLAVETLDKKGEKETRRNLLHLTDSLLERNPVIYEGFKTRWYDAFPDSVSEYFYPSLTITELIEMNQHIENDLRNRRKKVSE